MPLIDLIDWSELIIVSTALFIVLGLNLRFSLMDSLSQKENNTKTLFPLWRTLLIALISILIIISSFIYAYRIAVGEERFNFITLFGIGFFLGVTYLIDLRTLNKYIFCPKCSSLYSKVYSDKLIGIITKDEIKVFEKGEEEKLGKYREKLKQNAGNPVTSFILKREIKCKKCGNVENLYITINLKSYTNELIKSRRVEMLVSSFNFNYLKETIKLYPAIFEIRAKENLK